MMVELVIYACAFLSSGAPTCKEHVVPMNGATKLQCVVSQQINLAHWAAEHDGWTIKKFACVPATGKA